MELNTLPLRDLDPMPFGMYKGKLLQDVPTTYLHWLWHNSSEAPSVVPVLKYIAHALNALKLENRDLIWDTNLHKSCQEIRRNTN